MTFNVPEIVKKVAEGIMQKVDANTEDYADTDFTDIGVQDDLVQAELQDELFDLPDHIYDRLIENVIEHPEMQLCFEAAAVVVKDWKSSVVEYENERQAMIRDYYNSVLL